MSGRAFIVGSVVLNIALGFALYYEKTNRGGSRNSPSRFIRTVVTNAPRTHIVISKEPFTWSRVESEDYAIYIRNLRDIACPEDTIRDIIVADIGELYAKKRALLEPDDLEWWKPNPQQQVAASLTRKQRELDTERRVLLTELLGPDWDKNAAHAQRPPAVALTGPVLGAMPAETKQAVQDIIANSIRLAEESGKETGGVLSPLDAAKRRQQTREELAKVLTPTELEEFLLRWSQNATELRRQFSGTEVTADEFRAVFRSLDPLDQKLQLELGGDNPANQATREATEKQRDEILKLALGAERFQLMKLQQDPLFAQAREAAEKVNAPAETVLPIYQLNRATDAELQRIRADQTLTFEEREDALATTELERQRALRQLLGEPGWLKLKGNVTNPPAN
jgi:hypothetical protein